MARRIGRLKALTVARLKTPGLYPDGGGLYLQVRSAGARSWVFRFMLRGRAREMGLGSLENVPLAEARAQAELCRRQRAAGIDPIEAREALRAQQRVEAANSVSFDACCEAYFEAHSPAWRNPKHRQQWRNTIAAYVTPVFGAMPVQAVGLPQIMRVLEPIWTAKPETAGRVRGRIERILDWATTRGYRQGENPARWRGHLENLLPARRRVRKVKHLSALPWKQLGAFMSTLTEQEGTAALALRFAILTAARTKEVIGARWSEIDTKAALWVVPGERMKAGREHRVPLSEHALAVLREAAKLREDGSEFVFPSAKRSKHLSSMAMWTLLERMATGGTVHGFRSTFRDWAAECTNFPREAVEMALAHAISNAVEAAYRRGDLFEKRRQLMAAWARHCATVQQREPSERGAVVPIGR